MTTDPTTPPTRPRIPRIDPTAPVPGAAAISDATASIGDAAAAVPSARPDPSILPTGELLRTLTENIESLVRAEVASARREMTDKALAARPAAAMLGGAAVLGALAAGTSAVMLVRFLDRFLPPTTSAAVATALLGGGAAVLAKAGREKLRLIGPPVPERTIESVKADVAAVTEATPG